MSYLGVAYHIKGPDILTENISGMMKGQHIYDSADTGRSKQ